jgi:hypothetical protein
VINIKKMTLGRILIVSVVLSIMAIILTFTKKPETVSSTTKNPAVVKTAATAPITEIKVTRVTGSSCAYLYRVRDGKLVHFGGPTDVMKAADDYVKEHNYRLLSITPDPGETVVGGSVIAGIYITFQ